MTTFAQDIEEAARGEKIISIVIGEFGWGGYKSEGKPEWVKGMVLSWEEARPTLNYRYDDGYGTPECQAIYAWTENWVIAVSNYDGSTHVYSIPRNPVGCMPEMAGGG